jgi:hypothetical protein
MHKVSMAALAACALAFSATSGVAAVVNFENESPLGSDPTNVGMLYTNGGITFTSTENMQLVGVGAPTSGFVPDDMPVGGSFGDVFLTGDFNDNTNMNMTFGGNLSSISFDIADIDGGSSDNILNQSNDEVFTISYFMNSILQAIDVVTSNDVAGDGTITNFSFAGLFDEVSIVGTTIGGTRNIGWGIDNITTVAAVPVPAALPLLGSGFAALGLLGWRRRQKAA